MKTFFFWRSPNFGRKNLLILVKTFLRSPEFDKKTASISSKTDENLVQVRLLLFPASKKAPPPFEFLATRLQFDEATTTIMLVIGPDMRWIRGMAQKAINIAAN